MSQPWPRAVILVDMNAFFASIEQRDFPELRARPVAVTNGPKGATIITASYEARARGVRTGMHIRDALRLCPDIVKRASRPKEYAQVSTAIMAALDAITPELEVFSVDEAFLDVTSVQHIHGTPEDMGRMAKRLVHQASGLACSIGISGDKTTAKYAAKLQKPDGFTVIPPWEARERLKHVPMTELCGIKDGIGGFLAERGVVTCGDMQKIPVSVLAGRFGNLGRRIWLMAQGLDPSRVEPRVAAPKHMSASKVLPPNTRDRETLASYLQHMSELLALRMRQHGLQALSFAAGLGTDSGWIGGEYRAVIPTDDGHAINRFCADLLAQRWRGEGVYQVAVQALDPKETGNQPDLFEAAPERQQQLNAVMDRINARYGRWTLMPARMLNRSATPDVISPSWKPTGHRQTI
ncbi:MAG TPA: DNA polymerase IV [Gammaproteobacteria bacterium]|nr:DNA polymerase IV [Gammaproteobacteria bacterium]